MRRRFRVDPSTKRGTALARSADDSAAFRDFYEAYAERVMVFFTRRTRDVELAADLTSETFVLALERRRQFRGSTEEEEQGWLFAIARSQLHRFWQKGQAERNALTRVGIDPPNLSLAEIEQVERLADLPDLRKSVVDALGHLTDDQAYAVRQRVVRERSYAEISDELGVSEQVVRARVSRGLRSLAEGFGETQAHEIA